MARRTGIPVAELGAAERDRLLRLEELLHRRIVGQDEAVEAVADAVRSGRAGLGHPGRPVGSFLFLGPTGVGKTELGRALAEALFGSPDKLVRLDLSEYTDRSAVTRMIGAPPGHVGYEDAGQLTEAVRRDPYTVVLLDEIEKAHPEVAALLLQVLDAGRLTDAHGRTVDFRHAIVIMTSNIGADRILAAEDLEDVREAVLTEARARLRPELVGRVDEVVLFARLSRPELRRIVGMLLEETRERLRAKGVELVVDDAAADLLAGLGSRPELGARPLRRTVGKEVERRLARMLLAGDLQPGATVHVTAEGGELVGEGGPRPQTARAPRSPVWNTTNAVPSASTTVTTATPIASTRWRPASASADVVPVASSRAVRSARRCMSTKTATATISGTIHSLR